MELVSTRAAERKPFPKHWGPPPRIQTQDYRPLPGGYGYGSSTLKAWIQGKLDRDARQSGSKPVPGQKPFPKHWGDPPAFQTRDYRPLPGGYGNGSSTLAKWIQENLDRDLAKAKLKAVYKTDFTKLKTGEVPDEFMVLNGDFQIREENGNRFLELPGAPLDLFGTLFGPAESENIAVVARSFSTNNKRRYPAFAVGLNGVGGYRAQVTAGKRKLELFRADDVVGSIPFHWKPGTWTWLRLEVRKVSDNLWTVRAKAWPDGGMEPAGWMLTYEEKEKPFVGRPSVWGIPYAGTPIRFDNLAVYPATE